MSEGDGDEHRLPWRDSAYLVPCPDSILGHCLPPVYVRRMVGTARLVAGIGSPLERPTAGILEDGAGSLDDTARGTPGRVMGSFAGTGAGAEDTRGTGRP